MTNIIDNPFSLAKFSDRRSVKTGKVTGQQIRFANLSAKEIKLQLVANGVEKKQLKTEVNRILRGETDLRNAVGMAVAQSFISKGFTFDAGKLGAKTATINFVKVERPNVTSADVLALDKDSRKALLAELQAAEALETPAIDV